LRGFCKRSEILYRAGASERNLSRTGCDKAESIFVNEVFNAYFRQI